MCVPQTADRSIEDRVIDVVFAQLQSPGLRRGEIALETDFVKDLGADSLDVLELGVELEEEFSEGDVTLNIPDHEAEKLRTVGQAIDYITRKLSQPQPEPEPAKS